MRREREDVADGLNAVLPSKVSLSHSVYDYRLGHPPFL